ncbi:heavy-metal-associated domain-containing protein [Vacuolonema iberomarrocanum]|uniref:heavy-metal-associated domain-containing protein n=1 Tax=Vacuolonema iberomarrocanum TaxID=3454632 RepID=UPI0019EBF488|nr:heavy-metal-associated domain-containing protein [filamentous cyanobacterium LEGE 07170]
MKYELTVPDMACSACADTISKAVVALDPSAKVSADTETKHVEIETTIPEASVKEAITTAGYSIA